MRKLYLFILMAVLSTTVVNGQYSAVSADPSFRYEASPGFINITEVNYAFGLEDTASVNSRYYYGVTNIFGYQIDRNFSGGIGVGYLHYDGGDLFPLFLEYRYNMYMKRFTPYFYGDGGALFSPQNLTGESKIFINPGIGVSRAISEKYEINLSAGYMIQSRSTLTRVTFINFKAGISFRKNAFRLFRNDLPKI